MKTIIAILRIHTMNKTKEALSNAGLPSFTATGQVFGRGKGKWDAEVMEGVRNNQPEAIALLGPEPRLRLHRMITLTVEDSKVKTAVEEIMNANRTDVPGDGKIFVLPNSEVISIRTGESGDSVLD
ncbi:nitrogen regulatory protein P-II family [Lutibacter agarilyticus]|uniref:Nitrogen regulatory protein P-II family n=1 Tax=Lutibacter agarilyticus TaxID=1109740 RepID=A0A238YAE8_9FLAO|nr:P-II family nitrogen regulator [Lutibacter agarilyticus]SNR67932.1 nitrogen regulatory protein P-II family [Lutibacter agarilyticus]